MPTPIEQRPIARDAREAVRSVAAETLRSTQQERLRRAGERAAGRAQQQATPELGLRTLAYGEGEGLRASKDWREAQDQAKDWLKKAKETPPSRLTFRQARREAAGEEAPGERKSHLKLILEARKKVRESKEQVKQQTPKIEAAKREVQEFESQHADAIKLEQERLIDQAARRATDERTGEPRALTEDELKKIAEQARTNVAAAQEYDRMQREKVVTDIETVEAPLVNQLLTDRIAREQSQRPTPLTDEALGTFRKEIVNQLADRAMGRIREGDTRAREEEQQLVERPEHSRHFLEELSGAGIDIAKATPEQLKQAREKALAKTKEVQQEEKAKRQEKIQEETEELRQKPEWQSAYANLVSQELTAGTVLTPERQEELRLTADRSVRVEEAERKIAANKEEYEIVQKLKAEADARVRIVELSLQAKVTAEAVVGAKGKDKKTREQEAESAKNELTEALDRIKSDAERARSLASRTSDDEAFQQRADELEKRARSVTGLAKRLESQSSDQVRRALDNERNNQQDAQETLVAAKDALTRAELPRNLLTNSDIDIHVIPDPGDLAKIPASTAEQVNQALTAETPSERLHAITTIKEQTESNKARAGSTIILSLLIALAASMERVSDESTGYIAA